MPGTPSTALPFGSGFSPLLGEPRMGLVPIPNITVTSTTASTGTGAITLTANQLLGGLILVNCDDAQNAATPTAELLIAAIDSAQALDGSTGAGFYFDIVNTGDSTLTVTAGTGCTITGTATIATANGKRFIVVITDGVKNEAAYTLYSLGTYTF